jgi:hypothetical protein
MFRRLLLRVACCVLRVACCVLRVACCVLRVAYEIIGRESVAVTVRYYVSFRATFARHVYMRVTLLI